MKDETVVVDLMLPPLTRDEADYENNYDDGVNTWENQSGNPSNVTVEMIDGAAKISFPGGGYKEVYEKNAPQFKNGVVEMDITSEKPGLRLGISLRAKDINNRVYADVCDAVDDYYTEYFINGQNEWINMIKGEAFEAGRTMHLKVEIIDKTITLWVNGNQVLQNTMENLPLNAGTVGLNSRQANTVYVDNVKVTSYDLPTGELQNAAGRVVDTENSPIEGALAELLDSSKAVIKQTTTDALGNYKFKNIPLGEYTVRITSGKYTEEIPVTVTAGEDYVVIDKAVLGETADKTKLEDLIRQAEEIDLSLYTEETAQAVREALAAAKAVAEDPDAVQKDVDEAAEALQAAVDDLKEKADEPGKGDEQNPGGNDGDDTDEPDGTGTGEPDGTGTDKPGQTAGKDHAAAGTDANGGTAAKTVLAKEASSQCGRCLS